MKTLNFNFRMTKFTHAFLLVICNITLVFASWDQLSDYPINVSGNNAGACMSAAGSNFVYSLRGSLGDFGAIIYKYTATNDSWGQIATGYHNAAQGSDMSCGSDGYLYTVSGGNQVWSGKIDPATDTVIANNGEFVTPWPSTIMGGGGMVLDDEMKFAYFSSGEDANGAAGGSGSDRSDFMRYDFVNGSMGSLALLDSPMNQLQSGGGIVYAAAKVYFFHGESGKFFVYDTIAESYRQLTDLPGTTGEGLSFIYAGGDQLTGVQGGNSTNVWVYNIRSNSWLSIEGLPTAVGNGGGATWDGHYIYVMCGGNTRKFYRMVLDPGDADIYPPLPPELLLPYNGEVVNDLTPEFSWLSAKERGGGIISGYEFCLDNSTYISTLSTNYIPSSELSYAKHTWKVRAIDDSNNTSAWSKTWSVNIITNELIPDFCCVSMERTPKCNRYRVTYNGYKPILVPGTENDQRWPTNGQTVTYKSHIYNGGYTSGTCGYEWRTNGVLMSSGSILIPWHGFVSNSVSFPWPTDGEKLNGAIDIEFTINPTEEVEEISYTNNYLRETTRALALTFFISEEYLEHLSSKENVWGTYNGIDWIRTQFADMQTKFEQSVWAASPSGILERVRIDRILIYPNSAMNSALQTDPYKDQNDGRWQVWSGNSGDSESIVNTKAASYASIFGHRIDYGLIHEVGHQLGLIDIYTYDVEGPANLVTDEDIPALFEHMANQQGMMRTHGDHPFSEFSALGLNSQLGRRRGYYGDFQFLIPRTNIIEVYDANSNHISGAEIDCFRRTAGYFDDINETISGTTDSAGCFMLPNSGETYSTVDGYELHQHPFGYLSVVGGNQLLIRVRFGGNSYYYWYDCIDTNIEYWRGNNEKAIFRIYTKLCNTPEECPPPANVTCRMAGSTAMLSWESPLPNVASYNIYTTGQRPYDAGFVIHSTVTATNAVVLMSSAKRYTTISAVYSNGTESATVPIMYLPSLPSYYSSSTFNRYLAGIALLPNDQRLICIHNGGEEEPVWQRPGGDFVGMLSSVHNHLRPYDAEYDPILSRIIITDLNDGYNNEDRILVVDQLGRRVSLNGTSNPFGSRGSGDGQFNTPTGVAVDNQSRIYVADKDNNRIQVFDSNGNFITKYTDVSKPFGIDIDREQRVIVADSGNKRVLFLTWSGNSLVNSGEISYAGFDNITDIAHGGYNEVFVVDNGADTIFMFDNSGSYVTNFSVPNDGSGGMLDRPIGIACTSSNTLIVSDSGNRRVVEFRTTAVPEPYSFVTILLLLAAVNR